MVEHPPHTHTLLRAGVELRSCCCKRERDEKGEAPPVPALTVVGRRQADVDVLLLGTRSTSRLQKTQLLGSQRRVGGAFPGCMSLVAAECLMWTKSPPGAPALSWTASGAHQHLLAPGCLSTSVAGPEDRQTLSQGPGFGVPSSFPLLDGVLNRPPLSRAAAEDEVNASQATVLHFQAAASALIHDGSILGGDVAG